MPLSDRIVHADIPQPTTLINYDQVGEYEFVTDYELTNLRNRHIAHGLGVPVIVARKPSKIPDPIEEHYTRGMSFAATVILRFPDDIPPGGQSRQMPVQLDILDPRETNVVESDGAAVPIEKDLSTPLAKFLSNPDLRLLDTWGFVRPDMLAVLKGCIWYSRTILTRFRS